MMGYKRNWEGRPVARLLVERIDTMGVLADRYERPISPACSSPGHEHRGPTGTRDLDAIRRFVYREPRLTTGFTVDFVSGGRPWRGLCRDVSDAGIRAEFDDLIEVGSSGLLILRPPTGVLEIPARVAYIKKRQVGLLFLFQTVWERRMTIEFIAAITKVTGTSTNVRLP
jgi:hypothetical protein